MTPARGLGRCGALLLGAALAACGGDDGDGRAGLGSVSPLPGPRGNGLGERATTGNGFGFGEASANGVGRAPGDEPPTEEVAAVGCDAVCRQLVRCFDAPESAVAECIPACRDESFPEERQCIIDSPCALVDLCFEQLDDVREPADVPAAPPPRVPAR